MGQVSRRGEPRRSQEPGRDAHESDRRWRQAAPRKEMADDGAGQPPVQQGRHVAVPGRGAAGEVVEQRGLEGRPRVERIERHEEPVTGARLDGRPCPTQGLGKRAARGHVLRQARHGPGVARRRSAHSGPVDQVIAGDDQEAVTSRLRDPGGAPAPVDVGRPGDPADRHAALGQYRFELAARGAREDPWLGDPGPPESQHRPRGQRQPSHDLRRAGGLSGVSQAIPFRRIHSPEPLVGRRLPVSACRRTTPAGFTVGRPFERTRRSG